VAPARKNFSTNVACVAMNSFHSASRKPAVRLRRRAGSPVRHGADRRHFQTVRPVDCCLADFGVILQRPADGGGHDSLVLDSEITITRSLLGSAALAIVKTSDDFIELADESFRKSTRAPWIVAQVVRAVPVRAFSPSAAISSLPPKDSNASWDRAGRPNSRPIRGQTWQRFSGRSPFGS